MARDRTPRDGPADRSVLRRRILVVDDEDGTRLVLGRALARGGAQVFTAGGGREALNMLSTLDDLDAVVSDVSMPGMTGVELAYEILERRPVLPILFVTASTVPYDLLARPLVALLAKPPQLVQLHERLELLIARAAARPVPVSRAE
jgi:CheY-like chemotaxis protein